MKKEIFNLSTFSAEAINKLFHRAELKKYSRNQILLFPEKRVENIFFIKKGIMRSYRIINGEDITHHFYVEDWFATDYQSYITDSQSELYLETLSDCIIYEIKKESMLRLFDEFHDVERLGRIIAEDAYLQMVERLKSFQTMDLKERYNALMEKKPKLFNLVPQKHIASYLGVTAQSLSRIKIRSK